MTPEALDTVRSAIKQSNISDDMQADYSAQLKKETLNRIGKFILAAGGIGLGARGLLGVGQALRRNIVEPSISSPDLVPVEIPIPKRKKPEVEEFKAAGILSNATDYIRKTLSGDEATIPAAIPYAMPLATLGGMGAAYGGWKAMDYLLDSRRKARLEKEKMRAKQELHDALLSEFSNEKASSSRSSLGRDLDRLYDLAEKQAINAYDVGGLTTGLYGTAAGLAALASAMAAYKYTKARNESELLKKTMKMRNRRVFAQQPSAILAQIADDSTPDSE